MTIFAQTKNRKKKSPPSNLRAILVGQPAVDFQLPRPGEGLETKGTPLGCFLGQMGDFKNESQTKETNDVHWYFFWGGHTVCFCLVLCFGHTISEFFCVVCVCVLSQGI